VRDRVFIDTNVWVYLYLKDDEEKYKIAEEYLSGNNQNTTLLRGARPCVRYNCKRIP
jgi:predicted nucleic acid-binding protein